MEHQIAEPPCHAKDGVDLAPLVSRSVLTEKVQMRDIDPGPIDYVVKCIEGRFAGRFIYVNRSEQGEVFGSEGTAEVTMCIGNAGLSPKHAGISFDSSRFQYFLHDLGSGDGTWIAFRSNRSVELEVGQQIKVGKTTVVIEEGTLISEDVEVMQWLAVYQLQHLTPKLLEQGLQSLADVHRCSHQLIDMVGDSIDEAEEINVLRLAITELEKMFPASGYPHHALKVVVEGDGAGVSRREVCEVHWVGGCIDLVPEFKLDGDQEESVLGTIEAVGLPDSGQQSLRIAIGYSFGRYHTHLATMPYNLELQTCWARLQHGQRHWLQPGDTFQIGDLVFQVLRFNVGVHAEMGRRPSMEDKDIVLQDIAVSNWRHCSFFGVYDGHGGHECVDFICQSLHLNFIEALNAKGGMDQSSSVWQDVHDGFTQSFADTDRHFLSLLNSSDIYSAECGSAAVVVCIVGAWVWCANCGDSRAVLCRDGRAVQLSLDHKPDREDEKVRIEAAGGFVSWGRVVGRLALSRAFGDNDCKAQESGQLITSEPELRLVQLTVQDEFLLLACDGLFDVFTSQEAIDFVREKLVAMPGSQQDPSEVVKELVHEAIVNRHSSDNVTAIIISLKRQIQ